MSNLLLQDKVIFLTGGSCGIGLDCAKAYVAEGAKVIVVVDKGVNVQDPDELVTRYGADTIRLFLMFMGPWDQGGPWSPTGIEGVHRRLARAPARTAKAAAGAGRPPAGSAGTGCRGPAATRTR